MLVGLFDFCENQRLYDSNNNNDDDTNSNSNKNKKNILEVFLIACTFFL